MSENYKPGDIAIVTAGDFKGMRVMLRDKGDGREDWAIASKPYGYLPWAARAEIDDLRPLVVIDPEDREQAERFALGYIEAHDYARKPWDERRQESRDRIISAVQHGFRSLTRPPKPAEPTGLGAVVEDSEGRQWIRYSPHDGCSWMRQTSRAPAYVDYESFHAVRVLSEGVTA